MKTLCLIFILLTMANGNDPKDTTKLFLQLMGASKHFPGSYKGNWAWDKEKGKFSRPSIDYRESNPGLGLELHPAGTPFHFSAGAYKNSFDRLTAYVMAGLEKKLGNTGIGVGLEGGVGTGYHIPVLLAPFLSYDKGDVGVKAFVIPPMPGGGAVAVGLQGRVLLSDLIKGKKKKE